MDYEAAFLRERAARKKAEAILEEKSRELYLSNEQLKTNIDSLNSTLLQNNILLSVNKYGVKKQKLREFFPLLIQHMLHLAEIPFGMFEHQSFQDKNDNHRSDLIVNHKEPENSELPSSLPSFPMRDLIITLSKRVSGSKKTVILNLLDDSSSASPEIKMLLSANNIHTIVALPVISLDHIAGVIYLCDDDLSDKKKNIIGLFEDALKQLGMLVEHRYQEDRIEKNYRKLQSSNKALESAQNQLIQSEKMASVGQLSAGIAHEINNPMGFIKGNMSALHDYIKDYEAYISASRSFISLARKAGYEDLKKSISELNKLSESIDLDFMLEDSNSLLSESKDGIGRVIEIVSGLKRFSRQSDSKKELCDLQKTIEQALKLAQNELKYSVNVSTSFNSSLPVLANNGEITQVILNMLINAGHAIQDHGQIKIATEDSGEHVKISIADNGSGIPKEALENIFDPFFTTKAIGTGTGLGLSISFGIIQDHGGDITVETVINEGTTFNIILPAESTGNHDNA